MLLLAAFTSFLSLVQAEAFIAFDSVSCTSDISLFLKTEFSNALQLVVQTAAWVNPPLYDPIIQGYVETLFGPAQSDRDPVSFPRGVFSGLMGFNITMFADESELNNQEDLLVFCSPQHYDKEVSIYGGNAYYWDYYLRQWTFADEVDGLRNGEILAMLSRDNNRLKPSVLTLSTWWLNAAWTALYWDTGIISAYDYRSRISAWRQYPQLAPEFDNIVEVDWYKLFSHIILHELTHTWLAVGGDDATWEDLIQDAGYGYADCRALSGGTEDGGPEKNADSYTYLAILIDLYVNMLSTVSKDGNTITLFPGLTFY